MRKLVLSLSSLLLFCGCTPTIQEVKIAVPTKCDYSIPTLKTLKRNTYKEVVDSYISVVANFEKLKSDLRALPCLNILN